MKGLKIQAQYIRVSTACIVDGCNKLPIICGRKYEQYHMNSNIARMPDLELQILYVGSTCMYVYMYSTYTVFYLFREVWKPSPAMKLSS